MNLQSKLERMDVSVHSVLDGLRLAGQGSFHLLVNPLLYAGLLFTVLELRKNVRLERKAFGVRVTRVWWEAVHRWLWGLLAGILCSLVSIVLGIVLRPWEVVGVSTLTVLLGVIRLPLAAGLYSLMGWAIISFSIQQWVPVPASPKWMNHVLQVVGTFQVSSLIGLAGVWFCTQALFLWVHQGRVSPTIVSGKRGRTIGGFKSQISFVAPMWTIASGTVSLPSWLPASWPWLGTLFGGGIAMTGIPLLGGLSGVFVGQHPRPILRRISGISMATGIVLCMDSYLTNRFGAAWMWLGVFFGVFVWEGVMFQLRRQEQQMEPSFSQSNSGVKILWVLPSSLAAEMDLKPGEVITHVNQVPVHTSYDLHFAFEQNSAYAKLQVVDRQGEVKFVGKPVYSGERTNLGLVLAPDSSTETLPHAFQFGLYSTLWSFVHRKKSNTINVSVVGDVSDAVGGSP